MKLSGDHATDRVDQLLLPRSGAADNAAVAQLGSCHCCCELSDFATSAIITTHLVKVNAVILNFYNTLSLSVIIVTDSVIASLIARMPKGYPNASTT